MNHESTRELQLQGDILVGRKEDATMKEETHTKYAGVKKTIDTTATSEGDVEVCITNVTTDTWALISISPTDARRLSHDLLDAANKAEE